MTDLQRVTMWLTLCTDTSGYSLCSTGGQQLLFSGKRAGASGISACSRAALCVQVRGLACAGPPASSSYTLLRYKTPFTPGSVPWRGVRGAARAAARGAARGDHRVAGRISQQPPALRSLSASTFAQASGGQASGCATWTRFVHGLRGAIAACTGLGVGGWWGRSRGSGP